MKTRMPKLVLWPLAAVALAAGALLVDQPRQVSAVEMGFTITVGKVTVNQFGGIQVEGTIDCTTAVEAVYPDALDRPDMVVVNADWDAYQYVGRTKVVHAAYRSGIASPCYINGEEGPYPWSTVTPFPESHPTWMFSPDGRFASGRIHIEAFAQGGWEVTNGEPPKTMADLYAWGQADLKAGKAPRER